MRISAQVEHHHGLHKVVVSTGEEWKNLIIKARGVGGGSEINGGELLMAALATCFCNDLYREAAKLNIDLEKVKVTAHSTFAEPGKPGQDITYHAELKSLHSKAEIQKLIKITDEVAEIQNTIRAGVQVKLIL